MGNPEDRSTDESRVLGPRESEALRTTEEIVENMESMDTPPLVFDEDYALSGRPGAARMLGEAIKERLRTPSPLSEEEIERMIQANSEQLEKMDRAKSLMIRQMRRGLAIAVSAAAAFGLAAVFFALNDNAPSVMEGRRTAICDTLKTALADPDLHGVHRALIGGILAGNDCGE